MNLKLKNIERIFDITAPTERSIKGADKEYWVISFTVNELLSSDEIEGCFSGENITEMTFGTPLPNNTVHSYTVVGYNERIFNVIRHADGGSVELQFKKEAASTAVTE